MHTHLSDCSRCQALAEGLDLRKDRLNRAPLLAAWRRAFDHGGVHFGPGPTGARFIIDVLLQAGRYDVYLIGAPGRPQREQRTCSRFTDPSVGVRQRVVTWAATRTA